MIDLILSFVICSPTIVAAFVIYQIMIIGDTYDSSEQ